MQNKTMTRVIGGLGAVALIAIGMATAVPHMYTQDPAQQPPAGRMGRGRGPMGPDGMMGPGGRMGGPMGPMAGIERSLTDAQREQVKAIRDRHAEEMKPLVERMETARQALDNAVLTGIGDIRGLALDLGAAQGELAFQQAQIGTEVLALLTPEQKQQLQDHRKEMEAHRAEMQQRRQSRGNGSGTPTK